MLLMLSGQSVDASGRLLVFWGDYTVSRGTHTHTYHTPYYTPYLRPSMTEWCAGNHPDKVLKIVNIHKIETFTS